MDTTICLNLRLYSMTTVRMAGRNIDPTLFKMDCGEVYRISMHKLGRIRYVPPSYRTVMLNNPVQSTGADLLKLALGSLYKELAKHEDIKIVNPVHDSIVLEAPESRVEEAASMLSRVREQAGTEVLEVIPCKTDTKISCHWGEKG